jgi:hypothetical protein
VPHTVLSAKTDKVKSINAWFNLLRPIIYLKDKKKLKSLQNIAGLAINIFVNLHKFLIAGV